MVEFLRKISTTDLGKKLYRGFQQLDPERLLQSHLSVVRDE
jgi:hypothetical protein